MQSAVERRFAILEYLCLRRSVSVAELANEFGVCQRTINTDLQVLECSYPIYTVQGVGGGVFIAEGYKLGMKHLSDSQAELLERLTRNLCDDDKRTMESILKIFKKPGGKKL